MVTETVKEQSAYSAAFRKFQKPGGEVATWLDRLHESAFDRFEQVGFPLIGDEEWKYTNVAALTKLKFEVADAESHADFSRDTNLDQLTYEETRDSRLVFVNGIYSADLSSLGSLGDGVVVHDLKAAIEQKQYGEVIRQHLGRGVDYNQNGFTALNTAFASHGAFIYLPKGTNVEQPIQLLFVSDSRVAQVASFPRVLVVAEQDSSATIIEHYASLNDGVHLTNTVVEIVLNDGAHLEHYKVQQESAEAYHVGTTSIDLARNSNFETTAITLGAGLSRQNIAVRMNGEGGHCRVDGLYIVGAGQHTDTHSLIDHLLPNCTSRQLYKGILDGKSRAVFNGKVFVHEGAQQTDAQQTNRNLLLSKEARVDTKPQLEIFADDVKCAHGATVGQLEEEELFYLISRGLHPDLAQNLLTYGFAEEVIQKIKIKSIKEQLDAAVLNRLHAKLEV
jgi:Fe-S cluster assembly protein SufD